MYCDGFMKNLLPNARKNQNSNVNIILIHHCIVTCKYYKNKTNRQMSLQTFDLDDNFNRVSSAEK